MNMQKWLDFHWDEILSDIATLVSIPSVSKESNNQNAPFGLYCMHALNEALRIGSDMGFIPYNHEGYCGSLLWKGHQDKEIGIFTHLDVVPEGNDWMYEPFQAKVLADKVVGRGTSDNKGPGMIALYALKYLKDSGYSPLHSIRFFFGLNEECGMKDIEYYIRHNPMPEFSFTPDAAFPVCYAEKGTLEVNADFDISGGVITNFTSGVASNSVPSLAKVTLSLQTETVRRVLGDQKDIEVEDTDKGCTVIAHGVAAHAAFPEGSYSAQVVLAKALLGTGLLDSKSEHFMKSCSTIFADYYGCGIKIPFEDDISGKLTHIGGMAFYNNGTITQNINIRYPVKTDRNTLISQLQSALIEYGFSVKSISDSAPCYVDKENPIIQRLTNIANDTLGTKLEPYTMGGGTYARKLKNAVGYGPAITGLESDFGVTRGKGHQPDEYISFDIMKKAFFIYVNAIKELDKFV